MNATTAFSLSCAAELRQAQRLEAVGTLASALTRNQLVAAVAASQLEAAVAAHAGDTAAALAGAKADLAPLQAFMRGALCNALGIQKPRILIPKKNSIKKLVTYVPKAARDSLLEALFQAGAGQLGNYSQCSFRQEGEGSFLPGTKAQPTIGSPGTLQREVEDQLHLTFTEDREGAVLRALFAHHPYEEVAFEVTTLENSYAHLGMGMIGTLEKPLSPKAFLNHVKAVLGTPCIRHSTLPEKPVQRIAVLGGSGAFAIGAARAAGAEVFLTGDVKYHEFYQAEGKLLIADVGHYETEQFTKSLLFDYLTEKIPNFAISLSETKTNPVNYF